MSTDKIPPTGGPDADETRSDDSLADDMTPEALTALLAKNQGPQEAGELLRAKLLGETARAPWHELQRFFAQGSLLMAAQGVDMLDVAMALAEDNSQAFEAWLTAGEAGPVSDEQALAWSEADATLWTVVVRPWVLVQESGRGELGRGQNSHLK